jgi:hypothetical protein
LGHLRDHLTDVPPKPNSPPDYAFRTDQPSKKTLDPKLARKSVSQNKQNDMKSRGISRSPKLPLMLKRVAICLDALFKTYRFYSIVQHHAPTQMLKAMCVDV